MDDANISCSIFKPGFVHFVLTTKDSVTVGGHFLTPATMPDFVSTLQILEEYPWMTNDNKPRDVFRWIETYIVNLIHKEDGFLPPTKYSMRAFIATLETFFSRDRTELEKFAQTLNTPTDNAMGDTERNKRNGKAGGPRKSPSELFEYACKGSLGAPPECAQS